MALGFYNGKHFVLGTAKLKQDEHGMTIVANNRNGQEIMLEHKPKAYLMETPNDPKVVERFNQVVIRAERLVSEFNLEF